MIQPVPERVAVLETEQDRMQQDIADIREKVDAIHNLLMQAKGARWAVVSLAGAAGAVAGVIVKVFPFLVMRGG